MEYLQKKPKPIHTDASDIFDMEKNGKLTKDIEAQDLGLISYLDLMNYQNGHSFDPPVMTRNAMFWMGLCLPATAYIMPNKTRQSIYYLYSVHNTISKPYLSDSAHAMESQNMALIEKAMTAVLYRLISGRGDLDNQLRIYAPQILDCFQRNSYIQKAWGMDTVIGKFEAMPTLMGLMILVIYDKIFGTCLSDIQPKVLDFVESKLIDKKTGLFVLSYNTGYMGYPGEITTPGVTWQSNNASASSTGLALPLYRCFYPDKANAMWEIFKKTLLPNVLNIDAQQVSIGCGSSFVTALGKKAEDLFATFLCSKDLNDIAVFDQIQSHIYEIGRPNLWEGQVHYTAFGKYAHFIGAFIHLSRIHVEWKKLLSHSWGKYYDWDDCTNKY